MLCESFCVPLYQLLSKLYYTITYHSTTMFKKSLIICLLMACFATTAVWAQGGGMSDQQVMEYVEMGMQQGKSQQQIANELARRGVTREQAERVKKLYEQQGGKSGKTGATTSATKRTRTNEKEELASDKEYLERDFNFDNKGTTGTAKSKVYKYVTTQEFELPLGKDSVNFALDKNGNLVSKEGVTLFTEQLPEDQVFGRNIFNTSNLTFEPSMNLPTPSNYRLGAGDEVIIDIWGTNQTTIQQTISPDGAINVENLGLVFLNGMTVNQATSYLR